MKSLKKNPALRLIHYPKMGVIIVFAVAARRPIAVFKAPRNIGDFLVLCQKISLAIETGSGGMFPSPDPTVLTVNAAIADLILAQSTAENRTIGTADLRDV